MARLPQQGGDNGMWGTILNDFLLQSHKGDGSLKDALITGSNIQPNVVAENLLTPGVRAKLNKNASLDYVNVRDFGAVGDGTADDSAAIKQAEAAMSSGKCLFFPSGTYRFASQNPTGDAAIFLNGLSNVGVEFAPGARLLMDNLNGSGEGSGHGVRIVGSATNIQLINLRIEWRHKPAARSFGDGISILGYPSDQAPAAGWSGSTGTVSFVTILNCRVVNAPQTGAVIMGASDVTVIGFAAHETMADGLHFNASRRITVNGHHAVNVGDDGLAFVTYYDTNQIWQATPTDGPFTQPGWGEWNNSGSASAIVVEGGRANGFRVQGAYNLAITGVSVTRKEFGFQVNSSIAASSSDWTSIASRHVQISDVVIDSPELTGVVLATNNIDGTEERKFWDFKGLSISGVTIRNATNWSLAVEVKDGDSSKFAGLNLRDVYAEALGPDSNGPNVGGNGGILLSSLVDSTVNNVRLVSDREQADIRILGAAQVRGYVNGVDVGHVSVEQIPSSHVTFDQIVNDGPGQILVQDIAGASIGSLASYNANGEGINLYRVKDSSIKLAKAHLPARGTGVGRGVGIHQCYNLDISEVDVRTDSHVGSLWQSVEIGGGTADYPAGKGIRIEKIAYISTRDDTVSDVVIQGGAFAPIDWYAQTYWRHEGEANGAWRTELFGDKNPDYLAASSLAPTWRDPEHGGNGEYVDFDTLTTPGRYIVASPNPGFLFTDDAALSHQPPGAPGWVYLEVIVHAAESDSSIVVVLQRYSAVAPVAGKSRAGYRSKTDNEAWSEWRQDGFAQVNGVTTDSITDESVTAPKLSSGVQASLAKADSAVQLASVPWVDGPVDFNTLTTPGVTIVAGEFLNGDATTYNQPGNTGMIKLTVTTITPDVGGGPRVECIQEYMSIDGADKGGQRRRFDGSWSGWMKY